MRLPLQVRFKNVPPSEAIEASIHEKASKLERFNHRIMSCRVVVDSPQRRRRQGKLYDVRIDITVPGKEIAVTREENEDAYIAIRDAFDSAYRKLEEERRRERGIVKTHIEPPSGRVSRLFPEEQYGFILSGNGREIYFHRNSVLNGDFNKMKTGTEVSYLEEQGKEGPQAIRVALASRRRAAA